MSFPFATLPSYSPSQFYAIPFPSRTSPRRFPSNFPINDLQIENEYSRGPGPRGFLKQRVTLDFPRSGESLPTHRGSCTSDEPAGLDRVPLSRSVLASRSIAVVPLSSKVPLCFGRTRGNAERNGSLGVASRARACFNRRVLVESLDVAGPLVMETITTRGNRYTVGDVAPCHAETRAEKSAETRPSRCALSGRLMEKWQGKPRELFDGDEEIKRSSR